MHSKRRVAIVEDNKIFLDCYSHVVNSSDKFIVAGSYLLAEDAMKDLIHKSIEIVLMDIDLPIMNGIRATQLIKEKYPHIQVIMVSSQEDSESVIKSLKAGASGYITKSGNYLEIVSALEEVANGGAPVSAKVAKILVHAFHVNSNSPLTNREKEVLNLMNHGNTCVEIAEALIISRETVRSHIKNIYEKLNASSKSEAIKIALDNKFV